MMIDGSGEAEAGLRLHLMKALFQLLDLEVVKKGEGWDKLKKDLNLTDQNIPIVLQQFLDELRKVNIAEKTKFEIDTLAIMTKMHEILSPLYSDKGYLWTKLSVEKDHFSPLLHFYSRGKLTKLSAEMKKQARYLRDRVGFIVSSLRDELKDIQLKIQAIEKEETNFVVNA